MGKNFQIFDNAELVVVSDVHLRRVGDGRTEILLGLVDDLKLAKAKNFLLLGDIFDFCFGDSSYFREKFLPLSRALESLAKSGCRVIFMEGNHEFAMTKINWEGVELAANDSASLKLSSGLVVHYCHGDLINAPWSYKAFRWLVKNPLLHHIVRWLPAQLLDTYALAHAKLSRARDPYRILDKHKILGGAEAWLKTVGENNVANQCGVFGHFHVPFAELRNSNYLLSSSSWDEPSCLVYKDGRFLRGHPNTEKNDEWVLKDPVSVFKS